MAALGQVAEPLGGLLKKDTIVVSTAKGIEEDTLCLPNEVLKRCLPEPLSSRACFLSGPSFAIELAMALPTALSLASGDQEAAKTFQIRFSSEHCRLYRSSDVTGVCVGGALKNVIAIAAGACRSLALGRNALAALITRGLNEVRRLAICWGAKDETLSGLCGMGDLILSCTDELSRNHRLGFFIGQGMDVKAAQARIGGVVEGARTAKAIPQLLCRYGIEMPISQAVYDVLYNGLMVDAALSSLMSRKPDDELH
jgi:glycerol-3-phosphate dehydrogenase (NAD(P)+)